MRHCGKSVLLLLLLATTAVAQVVAPTITSIDPTSIVAGGPAFTLKVTGANFASNVQARINGVNRPTQFVDSQHLNITIPPTDLTSPRTLSITALNPGATASAPVLFQVVSNVPNIGSINPTIVPTGSPAITLNVAGTGFASDATVRINTNTLLATTFVSEKQLTAVVPASELTAPRTMAITVLNPPPINRSSNSVSLSVSNNVAPTITVVDPNTVVAGSPGFTLAVLGTNFVSNSVIRVNGALSPTTFVSATRLTTPITASQITTARTLSITVLNPSSNNATSNAVIVTVTSGNIPIVQSITPNAVQEGRGQLTLAVTGMNFTPTSIVRFNGVDRVTSFVDSRHLNATIQAADLAREGTFAISVFNPPPNGGTSSSVTLTVFSQFAPVITSLSPPNFPTASPSLKLIVTGARFGINESDVVLVDGVPRQTEFVNSTTLVATLLPEDVAAPGTHTVTVTDRTGFVSAPLTFTVSDQAGPVISTLDPSSAAVGAAPFILTVNGTNFVDQSIVTIDTTPRTTTFVSPTQLKVQITAADLASARDIAVAVLNPEGPPSTSVPLTVSLVAPTIINLSSTQAIAGDTGFTLLINGTGFNESSVVRVNGAARAATFDPITGRLSIAITPDDLGAPGTLSVTVTGPGGTSVASTVSVLRPAISSISPASIVAGSDNVVLTVSGTSFLPTSQIVFRGTARDTVFNAATGTLTTTLTAADLTSTGPIGVLVQNGAGILSTPFLITVTSPGDPRIDSLDPGAIAAGSSFAQLNVNGVNFLSGAVVRFNGVVKPTQFISSTQLVATLTAADIATAGSITVTVLNPDNTVSPGVTLIITPPPPVSGPRRRAVRR